MAEAFESCPEWQRVLIPGHGRAGRTNRVQLTATWSKDGTNHMKILTWGFLGQEIWLFTNRRQGQWLSYHSHENCLCPAIVNVRSIGQSYSSLNEIQWKWLHWEWDQVLTSQHKSWKRRLLSEPVLPSCVWPWPQPSCALPCAVDGAWPELWGTPSTCAVSGHSETHEGSFAAFLNPHSLHQVRFEDLLSSSKPVRDQEIKQAGSAKQKKPTKPLQGI